MWDRFIDAIRTIRRRAARLLTGDTDEAVRSLGVGLADVDARLREAERRLEADLEPLRLGALTLDRWPRVAATTRWCARAPLRHHPRISVILPTRDRSGMVVDAIRSVLAQTYEHWQLVIVDDGSVDDTAEVIAGFVDDRIVVLRGEGRGASAARNAGIAKAEGEWVAFCDDDNVMDEGWLRAIAEFTGREPDTTALFGAQLRDDVRGGDVVPWLLWFPDRDLSRLRHDNTIDLGMLAVRRDHPELRFDETLRRFGDWELVVRLHQHDPLRPLGALSGYYSTQAAVRITDVDNVDELEAMRRRLAAD
jgi:hypothetical protein